MRIQNLLRDLPAARPAELFEPLLAGQNFRLERIVSTGQSTPPGEWLEQDLDEWVVLLSGAAALRFDDDQAARTLSPGDYLSIPAHARHRVEWTHCDEPTVWLALHYRKQ